MQQSEIDRWKKCKQRLDSIGPGFCLAKWNQVTFHLGSGMVHSCHHPAMYRISEEEIKGNPTALHNTRHAKCIRKAILEGKRPPECEYCWNIENTSEIYSDRVFKSSEPWASGTFDEIKNLDWQDDWNPRYVEVAFSNICNQRCLYCGPSVSSAWQEESKRNGPINLPGGYLFNLPEERDVENLQRDNKNPYVEAFWKWWPELFKSLHTFRVTGGDALLDNNTMKALKYIQEHYTENPGITVGINTNLNVSEKRLSEFLEVLSDLSNNNKVRDVIVFTSIESTGKQAEYVRRGMNIERFWKNLGTVLQKLPKTTVTIMATYNILSVESYSELISKVYELKKRYHNPNRAYGSAILLDTSYLRYPDFLSVRLCSEEQLEKVKQSARLMEKFTVQESETPPERCLPGFLEVEIEKMQRVVDYIQNSKEPFDYSLKRKQLKSFIREVDGREGTSFEDIFGYRISE